MEVMLLWDLGLGLVQHVQQYATFAVVLVVPLLEALVH